MWRCRRAGLFVRIEERLAPGVALVDAVVVRDLVFAGVPAEQDLLTVAQRGKVEETALEVLDEHAGRLDPLHAPGEGSCLPLELRFHLGEVRGRQITPVRAGAPGEIAPPNLRLEEPAMVLDHLEGDRAELGQRVVRLVDGVVAGGHAHMIPAVVQAGQRVRPVLGVFLGSRAALWAAVAFAYLVFEPNRHPDADRWDRPEVTGREGFLLDIWTRWDSVWFLRIAEDGYGATEEAAAAFYPLYPLLVGLLGRVLLGHYVLAGVVVSLASALVAFALLRTLALAHLGEAGAPRAVLYLAIFPFTLFLGAVYSEALFLALALASFVLAERGRFLGAGVAAGLAWLTRPLGVVLLPALLVIAWRSRDPRGALLRLATAPALFTLYPLYLWWRLDDPLAFVRAEATWNRQLSPAGPLGGVWDGLRAGWAGARQLASSSDSTRYWSAVQDADPDRVAMVNLQQLAFLVVFAVLAAVAWRRFGAPYGLFAALSLLLPLSVPSERWPLLSIPRFGLVVFPLFLALAHLGRIPRVHTAVIVVSAMLLGVVCAQWALWQWVA